MLTNNGKVCERRRRALAVALSAAVALLALPAWGDTTEKKEERDELAAQARQVARDSYVPSGGWEAYFRDASGFSYPVILPAGQNPDEDWLGLEFTDYTGPRTRIAVMDVANEAAADSGGVVGMIRDVVKAPKEVPLAAIEELLTAAIFNTHRFDVIDRQDLQTVMQEQDFGKSGRVTEQSAAKIGRLVGAQYMLFTSMNEWTPKRKAAGGIGARKTVAEVAMSFRIVEVASSRVAFARTFRATATDATAGVPGLSMSSKEPVNYAVIECINKAAYDIAMSLKDAPWSGAVVKVAAGVVTINAGSNQGMRPGVVLTALAAGEELIDPETGESLGADTRPIGTLTVVEVKEKYSKASVAQGCKGLKAGDRVEFLAPESGGR